jgi:EAL domain-containing protein (putative c-di-GMP-specific phosphodiesterase class I)
MSIIEESELKKAMTDKRLVLCCQPRISAQSLQIVGVDTVVCWKPAAENWVEVELPPVLSGETVSALWQWKLGQLESMLNAAKQSGYDQGIRTTKFFISLDILPAQLQSDLWSVHLIDVLARHEPRNCSLELRLPAHAVMSNGPSTDISFESVREKGVALLLDNFPAMPSSFVWLAHYRFDKVKVDKSMLPGADDSVTLWARKRELLKGLVAICKSIDVDVLFSGIDREVQFNFFRELALAEWQGELWGGLQDFANILPRIGGLPHNDDQPAARPRK